uniref:OTU domain-containing protein n=1 Tax=Arcella intermedia TaxID=1963864 RepID=A0A6B2L5Q9_9EUKA
MTKSDRVLMEKDRKKQERLTKQQIRKERSKKTYGDAEWKREFDLFLDQLKIHGLTIRDVAGDGNCLFRAMADQFDGDPNKHPIYRTGICNYIEKNREQFEPFIEDDEPFTDYLKRMRKNATWGGHLEIQACSLAYTVNITIHQLGQPRWDIKNFDDSVKTIHLSYHQGEHYSSVRKIGDERNHRVPPKEITIVSKAPVSARKEEPKEKKERPPPEIQMVMDMTGCTNQLFVRLLLEENFWDVDSTVEFIFTVGPHNVVLQEEYIEEQSIIAESKRLQKEYGMMYQEKVPEKVLKNEDQMEKKEDKNQQNKNNNAPNNKNNVPNSKNNNKNVNVNDSKENVQPKIQNNNHLSNKQRKELQRAEKEAQNFPPPKPNTEPTTPQTNPETLAQDLGSMQI